VLAFRIYICDGTGVAVQFNVNLNKRNSARLADVPAIFCIRNQQAEKNYD